MERVTGPARGVRLRSTVRLQLQENVPKDVKERFGREWVFQRLIRDSYKKTAEDLLCLQDFSGAGFVDITFYLRSVCAGFYDHCCASVDLPDFLGLIPVPLFADEELPLTIHVYNPWVPDEEIVTFLLRYCSFVSAGVRVLDNFGIWCGRRRFRVRFKETSEGFCHPPGSFSIGPNKGFLFYPGQPLYCRRCGQLGHTKELCTGLVCRACGGGGHIASACPLPKDCGLCGAKTHLYRNCPKRGSSYAAVLSDDGVSKSVSAMSDPVSELEAEGTMEAEGSNEAAGIMEGAFEQENTGGGVTPVQDPSTAPSRVGGEEPGLSLLRVMMEETQSALSGAGPPLGDDPGVRPLVQSQQAEDPDEWQMVGRTAKGKRKADLGSGFSGAGSSEPAGVGLSRLKTDIPVCADGGSISLSEPDSLSSAPGGSSEMEFRTEDARFAVRPVAGSSRRSVTDVVPDICGHCNRRIGSATFLVRCDRYWHDRCATCKICGHVTKDIGVVLVKGHLVCAKHSLHEVTKAGLDVLAFKAARRKMVDR